MLTSYIRAAMHQARYEILPDDATFYGEIPGFDGVYANAETGEYSIFISQAVLNEIDRADEPKKSQLIQLIKGCDPQVLDITQEVTDLAKEYISQKVIPESKVEDALHVAIATVYEMDALITWNNKHLANLRKIGKINSINLKEGYTKHLEIVNPMEVITDEG